MRPSLAVMPSRPDPDVEDAVPLEVDDTVHGHAPIDDPAELAMVFSVDGVTYLRLSNIEPAAAPSTRVLVKDDFVTAVIAPVAPSALPAAFAGWRGRRVLVDGACAARVVGFAEVSRILGEPPVDDESEPWKMADIVDRDVVLAARLDGCTGTWARADDRAPAAIARLVDEPELETAAIAELTSEQTIDVLQAEWEESGGEGDWRDAVAIDATTYVHPLTDERWVFVQAASEDIGCGEASVSAMVAYRADAGGTLRRFSEVGWSRSTIREVVDIDADGQPELMFGGGESTSVVDLSGEQIDGIDVQSFYEGCGC